MCFRFGFLHFVCIACSNASVALKQKLGWAVDLPVFFFFFFSFFSVN